MNMPLEISRIIQDYARPYTRATWKLGCAFAIEYKLFNYIIHSVSRDYKIRRIIHNFTFIYHAFYNTNMIDYEDDYEEDIL